MLCFVLLLSGEWWALLSWFYLILVQISVMPKKMFSCLRRWNTGPTKADSSRYPTSHPYRWPSTSTSTHQCSLQISLACNVKAERLSITISLVKQCTVNCIIRGTQSQQQSAIQYARTHFTAVGTMKSRIKAVKIPPANQFCPTWYNPPFVRKWAALTD